MVVDPEQHRRGENPASGPLAHPGLDAAARPVSVPFVSRPSSEASRTSSTLRKINAARVTWARWANWVVGISSGGFLLIALGGYLYHRGQLAEIAAEHLRLMVTGPAKIAVGVAQRYTARATTVTGHPVPAQVEFTWFGPDGQQLMAHKEAADEHGAVNVTIEADARWQPEVRMEVVASYSVRTERVETPLTVEPQGRLTALCLERIGCRPGETLRYRSLTLSRFALAADQEVPIRFEVRAPNGSLVADSVREGITVKGVGWGEFPIPRVLSEGVYSLHAISLDGTFPEVRRRFAISASRPFTLKTRETPVRPIPSAGIRVSFRPEGGDLVAGMSNRLYFVACDGEGKPARMSGRIVDGQDRAVAAAETAHEGMGSVQFEPHAGQEYWLKVDPPVDGQAKIKLPPVSGNHSVVLTTGLAILEPGSPLEFNVRATAADLPLVAVVSCRGIEVGQQVLVTSMGANTVTVPLHEDAAGTLRLALYEYRSSTPKLVAERLIYRRPRQRLEVKAVLDGLDVRPGQSIDLPLLVSDEQGRPVPADVSVAVFDENAGEVVSREGSVQRMPGPRSQFLLLGELEVPEAGHVGNVLDADSYLSADPKSPAALDFLLGALARRQPSEAEGTAETSAPPAGTYLGCPPPMMFDNLHQLMDRYQTSLASYRVNRTRVLNALTTLSFFGGIGLVVFVAMLSLLNVPCGLRLWGPAMGVAAACIVIGAVLMDPERLKRNPGGDIPFAPFSLQVSQPSPSPVDASRPQNLRAFLPLSDAVQKAPEPTADRGGLPASLVWRPLVSTDQQGRAAVRVQLPSPPGSCRIVLDVHAEGGRLGASIARMSYPAPPRPEKKESDDKSSHSKGAAAGRGLMK
jgi:hypothetical protein